MELGTRGKTVFLPVAAGALIIVLAVLLIPDAAVVGNLVIIGMFVAIIPYFVYRYSKYAWLKGLERQFPNFIRDLADSKRSGMTLETAVTLAAKSNYGKLSPEIVSMANKLSWGTPFIRVIDIFESRVKESASIREVLNILREAYKSGGNVVATLDSAARNMNMLREAEEERRNITSQHVMITYGIFFLFLGIVVMIIYILVPMMSQQGGFAGQENDAGMGLTTFTNPCADFVMPFPCGLFRATCTMLDVDSEGISCYYVSLFFFVLLIQGISSGLIAGQLGENSVVAGTKHSIIMVSISIFVFVFLAKMGVFPA